MRKSISLGLITLFLLVCSNTAIADPAEGLCDKLNADGFTKGLFGLCVAFHNAGEDRRKILDKYNAKKQPGDPDMPMDGECPCWSIDQLAAVNEPLGCVLNFSGTSFDRIVFDNAQFFASDVEGNFFCVYNFEPIYGISQSEAAQCVQDIIDLAEIYFSDGCVPR